MVLLILIGMDHSTPEDLRQQIVGVIDGLCCSMAIGNEVVASLVRLSAIQTIFSCF